MSIHQLPRVNALARVMKSPTSKAPKFQAEKRKQKRKKRKGRRKSDPKKRKMKPKIKDKRLKPIYNSVDKSICILTGFKFAS